jgi:hypothetical protein
MAAQASPPPMPPAPPGAGLGPASPLGFAFTDLSVDMPSGWQIVDIAVRLLKTALRTTDFQETPKAVAVISSVTHTLGNLISHYAKGVSGSSKTTGSSGPVAGADGDSVDAVGDVSDTMGDSTSDPSPDDLTP